MAKQAGGDVLSREDIEKTLFPARGLPGGGQLEIRMEVSADHPDLPSGAVLIVSSMISLITTRRIQTRFDRRTYIADWFMKQLDAG
jgi:hypothetical protein